MNKWLLHNRSKVSTSMVLGIHGSPDHTIHSCHKQDDSDSFMKSLHPFISSVNNEPFIKCVPERCVILGKQNLANLVPTVRNNCSRWPCSKVTLDGGEETGAEGTKSLGPGLLVGPGHNKTNITVQSFFVGKCRKGTSVSHCAPAPLPALSGSESRKTSLGN